MWGLRLMAGTTLIGMQQAEPNLFERITWSTGQVFAETLDRAREIQLAMSLLNEWYDVDDAFSLDRLQQELREAPPGWRGYHAPHSRAYLQELDQGQSTKQTCGGPCLSRRSNSAAESPSWIELGGAPWLTNAALLLFGLLIIQFCRTGVLEYEHYTYGFSAGVFAQLVLYLGALALVERCPKDKWTLPIIFTIAVLARLVCIFHPAFLSTDVYRYVWDGKVQGVGINPFRYIPADSHLSFLRDSSIYPKINRRDYAHTIYPPGAQAIFFAVTRLGASEPLMKLAMTTFEAATCFVLMRILALAKLPRERVLLYAWNPLCLWEIASSGHVDAAALTFISLSLYATVRDHRATGRRLAWGCDPGQAVSDRSSTSHA